MLVNLAATSGALATVYIFLGAGARRLRVFRIVLIALGVGLCLGLLEAPAIVLGTDYRRVFNTQPAGAWLQVASKINQADPVLLHRR